MHWAQNQQIKFILLDTTWFTQQEFIYLKVDMSKNSELTIETFLLMLEYLYTGNVALDCENVDLAALLMLSDQYNITRLTNLCELHLTKRVNRKVPVETSDIDDVIGLLNISKVS